MKKRMVLWLCLGWAFAPRMLMAQEPTPETTTHTHPRNEIGFGVSGVYEIEHGEWTPGVHLHYYRSITPHSRWALGGGIEYLKGDEKHFEVGMGVRYEPVAHLHLTLAPGITITGATRLSLHTEATYEILGIGNFHLGPVVGYAWSLGHSHLSVGVHAAVGF